MTTPSERRRRVKRSQRQEGRLAKRHGLTQHGGSGNGIYNKNDGHTPRSEEGPRLHVEAKRTDNRKQITVKVDDLVDVERNAAEVGRVPVLAIEINGRDYYIVRPVDFLDAFDR